MREGYRRNDGVSGSKIVQAVMLVFTILLIFLVYPVLAHEEGEGGEGANLFKGAETIVVPYVPHPDVIIDGKIGTGEYSPAGVFVDEDTGMEAHLLHDGENLYVGLKNPGQGWVAIGFGVNGGASVIIGYVDDGTLRIREFYASEITGEMEVGAAGNSDITTAKGVESRGTAIEFVVPLSSGERHLEPGKVYPLIIAFNDSAKEFPTALDLGEIHFEKAYIVRQSDNLKDIEDLFAGKSSPLQTTSTVIAMAVIGLSTIALLVAYSGRGEG